MTTKMTLSILLTMQWWQTLLVGLLIIAGLVCILFAIHANKNKGPIAGIIKGTDELIKSTGKQTVKNEQVKEEVKN